MNSTVVVALCAALGYLLGSVPTGYLVAKARGVDIQNMGSGNIGATNILRSVGIVPAIIVILMDPLKALLAMSLPLLLGLEPWAVATVGVAVMLGNIYNVFLGFRGGKGIATSLGVYLSVEPLITVLITLLAVMIMAVGRYVSLGALMGASAAPLMLIARGHFEPAYFALAVVLVTLAFIRHRSNLIKLAKGTERRLGEKATKLKGPDAASQDAALSQDAQGNARD